MATLRELAEQAARELTYDEFGGPTAQRVADAIERVSRQFAERALRASYRVHVFGITMDEAIPRAIAAAERGE